MNCKNPKLCNKKHLRWKKEQKLQIPIGEKEHEVFLDNLEKGIGEIILHGYSNKRQFERLVSKTDLRDVLLNGWVIERNSFSYDQGVRLLIHGYTKNYRPVNLVFEVNSEYQWTLITTYSPMSKAHKWSDDFQERLCFCKD